MDQEYRIGYYLETDIQHIPPVVRLYPILGGYVFTNNKEIFDYLDTKYKDLGIKAHFCKNKSEIHKLILKHKIRVMIYPGYQIQLLGKAIQIFHGGLSDKNYVESVKIIVYDKVLFPGEKTKDKVEKSDYLKYIREWELVGYPKFDPLINKTLAYEPVFKNDRKTILYGPTWISQNTSMRMIKFSPHGESSLELWSRDIIRELSKDYNIIIKYHSRMFRKPNDIYDQIDELINELRVEDYVKVKKDDNILQYMDEADLMISDISTACYEWFHFDRPIVFANPYPEHYKSSNDIGSNTYAWQAGDVITETSDIKKFVSANLDNDVYKERRNEIFHYTIYKPDGNATNRQADAIKSLYIENEKDPYFWLILKTYLFRRYRRNLSKMINIYYKKFKPERIGK